jgi:C-terminal processing protease CtpA/Prc
VPQSPATEAGIEAGDILDFIDNRPAEDLTLTEIRSMLRRASARYSIGILRGIREEALPRTHRKHHLPQLSSEAVKKSKAPTP